MAIAKVFLVPEVGLIGKRQFPRVLEFLMGHFMSWVPLLLVKLLRVIHRVSLDVDSRKLELHAFKAGSSISLDVPTARRFACAGPMLPCFVVPQGEQREPAPSG